MPFVWFLLLHCLSCILTWDSCIFCSQKNVEWECRVPHQIQVLPWTEILKQLDCLACRCLLLTPCAPSNCHFVTISLSRHFTNLAVCLWSLEINLVGVVNLKKSKSFSEIPASLWKSVAGIHCKLFSSVHCIMLKLVQGDGSMAESGVHLIFLKNWTYPMYFDWSVFVSACGLMIDQLQIQDPNDVAYVWLLSLNLDCLLKVN